MKMNEQNTLRLNFLDLHQTQTAICCDLRFTFAVKCIQLCIIIMIIILILQLILAIVILLIFLKNVRN